MCDGYTTGIVREIFPERSAFGPSSLETVAFSSRDYQTSQDIQCKDAAFDASQIYASVSFHWLLTFTIIVSSLEM